MGRKKVFVISLILGIIGYLILGFGVINNSLFLIFLGRVLDGISGGNYTLALAAMSDIALTNKKVMANKFGFVAVPFTLGLIIGPYIGSKLSDPESILSFGTATPFWFAAILVFINLILIILFFVETITKKQKGKITIFTGLRNIITALKLKKLREVFLVVFLFNFSNLLYVYFFQIFFIKILGFDQNSLSGVIGYYVVCAIIGQVFVSPYLSKKVSTLRLLEIGLITLSVGVGIISLTGNILLIWIILMIVAFLQVVIYVNLLALITTLSAKDSRGGIFGVNQSIESIAQISSLIFAGALAAIYLKLPAFIAAIFYFIAGLVVLIIIRSRFNREKLFEESEKK